VAVEAELARLRAENARLLKLLRLSPQQAAPPVPGQAAFFEAAPGLVHHRSPQEAKVAFFGALFAARTDVYAVRYDNQRTGKSGWVPAVRGGRQKGVRHEDRGYLPLTAAVLAAHRAGKVTVATEVTRLSVPSSTATRPPAPPVLSVRLGAGIRLEQAQLTPGLAATLRHAASMHNPDFYERQRMRASTYNIPRFLHCYQETIDGGLILPRGMLDTVTSLAAQAGSRLDVTDRRSPGTARDITCSAALTPAQQDAVTELARHDLGVLVAPPGAGKTVMACAVIATHPRPLTTHIAPSPQAPDPAA
jgi:hypothetical protein